MVLMQSGTSTLYGLDTNSNIRIFNHAGWWENTIILTITMLCSLIVTFYLFIIFFTRDIIRVSFTCAPFVSIGFFHPMLYLDKWSVYCMFFLLSHCIALTMDCISPVLHSNIWDQSNFCSKTTLSDHLHSTYKKTCSLCFVSFDWGF